MEVGPRIIFRFDNGFVITETVCWAVIVAAVLAIALPLLARNLQRDPKGAQGFAELLVEYTYNIVKNTMGKHNVSFAPFIGSIFFFILISNALGIFGIRAVTADMNATFALGILVFFVIQITGIRSKGGKGYLKHFLQPYPFMVFSNIVEEFTFVLSLSFRIFGNILAGFIIMELFMQMLQWLSTDVLPLPIPLLQIAIPLPLNFFFDMFEAGLQAYVFTILCMSFLARASVVHSEE